MQKNVDVYDVALYNEQGLLHGLDAPAPPPTLSPSHAAPNNDAKKRQVVRKKKPIRHDDDGPQRDEEEEEAPTIAAEVPSISRGLQKRQKKKLKAKAARLRRQSEKLAQQRQEGGGDREEAPENEESVQFIREGRPSPDPDDVIVLGDTSDEEEKEDAKKQEEYTGVYDRRGAYRVDRRSSMLRFSNNSTLSTPDDVLTATPAQNLTRAPPPTESQSSDDILSDAGGDVDEAGDESGDGIGGESLIQRGNETAGTITLYSTQEIDDIFLRSASSSPPSSPRRLNRVIFTPPTSEGTGASAVDLADDLLLSSSDEIEEDENVDAGRSPPLPPRDYPLFAPLNRNPPISQESRATPARSVEDSNGDEAPRPKKSQSSGDIFSNAGGDVDEGVEAADGSEGSGRSGRSPRVHRPSTDYSQEGGFQRESPDTDRSRSGSPPIRSGDRRPSSTGSPSPFDASGFESNFSLRRANVTGLQNDSRDVSQLDDISQPVADPKNETPDSDDDDVFLDGVSEGDDDDVVLLSDPGTPPRYSSSSSSDASPAPRRRRMLSSSTTPPPSSPNSPIALKRGRRAASPSPVPPKRPRKPAAPARIPTLPRDRPYEREIRRLQRTTHLVIPRRPFGRVVKELTEKISAEETTLDAAPKWQGLALTALQEASEIFLVNLFEDAHKLAFHAKRATLFPTDLKLLQDLRGLTDPGNP